MSNDYTVNAIQPDGTTLVVYFTFETNKVTIRKNEKIYSIDLTGDSQNIVSNLFGFVLEPHNMFVEETDEKIRFSSVRDICQNGSECLSIFGLLVPI